MGYLMKEALKALCGVNQWSYAVFWKIGCQNPKLLIWEECYYESLSSSNANTSTIDNQRRALNKIEGHQNRVQAGDRVHLLVDKMMMSNQVNVVGEGLVGRAAFTGDHQWFVSGTHNGLIHPEEVLNEVHFQFSAGMQTIAVIPVIPHGVVQFGSPLAILENVGFVRDVRSLIHQLGCVPSALISDNYISKEDGMFGLPVGDFTVNPIGVPATSMQMNSSPLVAGNFNQQRNSSDAAGPVNQSSDSLLTQFQDNLQVSGSSFMLTSQDSSKSNVNHCAVKTGTYTGSTIYSPNDTIGSEVSGGVSMPLKRDLLMSQAQSEYAVSKTICPQSSNSCRRSSSGSNMGHQVTLSSCNTNVSSMRKEIGVGIISQHNQSFPSSPNANTMFPDTDSSIKNMAGFWKTVDQSGSSSILGSEPYHGNYVIDSGHTAKCIPERVQGTDVQNILKTPSSNQGHVSADDFISDSSRVRSQATVAHDLVTEDTYFQSSAGDDLFDILGVNFKNKLLNFDASVLPGVCGVYSENQMTDLPRYTDPGNYVTRIDPQYDSVSESGVFSLSGSDHLLDAVISGVASGSRQTSDDSMSCRTAVSKLSSPSVPSTPHSNSSLSDLFSMSESIQQQLFGVSKPVVKLVDPMGKSVGGNYSMTSSTFGSQISSRSEHGPATSASTANSKKSDEGGKSNRKRLKPGENPRPRPKDRQMIQDRVKELRDIVPNGAKCSIDALLERTIKHMLFLQSVTKHADKLKQTVESKINKKGAMLPNDDFEGGATWAFELGSQSMVCPIVVEDLSSPRQLLIEMLCEERGLFLEIADLVRGLGLTILKGVMEARNDKIWARFAVEADRDVTRMEVFISLVHLLEQTLKSNPLSVNGTSDMDMGVYPSSMPTNQQFVGPIVCGEPSTT